MQIKDYFRAFTEDELARGAELFFSGDLEDITKKAQNTLRYLKEKEDSEKATGPAVYQRYPQKGTAHYTAKWNEQGVRKKNVEHTCELRLHEESGTICETKCDCGYFAADRYGCPHVAGLLTAYMAEKNGAEVFQGTRLEILLRNLTNVEDPFVPGVLKRTDGRLLSLLKGSEEASLPTWQEASKSYDTVRIECSLVKGNGRMLLDLKIGTGRRLYQVQDIRELLKIYRNAENYLAGKSEFHLERRCCEAVSGNILEFLNGIAAASEKGLIRTQIYASEGTRPNRYMVLSGPEFDGFMELCEGTALKLSDNEERNVALEKKGLCAILKKKAYGASLRIFPSELLFDNGVSLYLYDDTDIFRIRSESTERSQELLSMLKWTDEMYIRESEIGSVCYRLLPVFREFGTVITKGMDFENYEKELPEFIFNLDYSSGNILSCVPWAEYRKQEAKYLLFDNETGSGRRYASRESEAAAILQSMFQRLDRNSGTLFSELTEEELFDFMKDSLPVLETTGKVMVTDSLRRNRVRSLPKVHVGVSVDGGRIFMSLKGTDISPMEMADILGAYHKKKKYYRLKSGEFFAIEEDEGKAWETAAAMFRDYGKKDPESISIPAFRALYLQEMLEGRQDAEFEANDEYRQLIRQMDVSSARDCEVPKTLENIIRPYQTEGFRWIKMLKRCGFGGILADDMGLGKTLQVLAFLLSEKQEGKQGDALRTLVVCPASLVYNWQREAQVYAGELSTVVIAGTQAARRELIEASYDVDLWITSYDLLKRDIALYEPVSFANEIIDEAQFVKNQKTQAAQSVRVVNSSFRMALTGTPIENYLSELWSIMDYLMPGILFSYSKFQGEYETPIVSKKDADTLDRLRRMVHPFILRRMKKQVLKELPDKLEEVVSVRMEGEQKKLYDASVEEIRLMLDNVNANEFKSSKLQFLAKLTGLRQICCDPSLIYDNYKGASAKLEACMELVKQAVDGGHKLLLFSQFTTMLDIIGARLNKEETEYYRIDGSVSKEKRMQMVDSFANDEVMVFLISLKAGGTGLNLTAADIVIHYDPWWNQAAQDQATDRTHRIGQTQRVTVYELIVQETVEERIQRIKEGKRKLVEDVLSGEDISSADFNREDMLELLQ